MLRNDKSLLLFNSDVCSNSLRVIKTNKQTQQNTSYNLISKHIIEKEGIQDFYFVD